MFLGFAVAFPHEAAAERPNIVPIYADDLGFGDVSCNGAKAGLTPNVGRLAKEGPNLTKVHATSVTCTPSRHTLLTGRYPWRRQGTGVLPTSQGARRSVIPGTTGLPHPSVPRVGRHAGPPALSANPRAASNAVGPGMMVGQDVSGWEAPGKTYSAVRDGS